LRSRFSGRPCLGIALRSGLHQYLEHFLDRINDLGNRISQDFLVPLSA